ncbi:hypothetical protein BC829DRAFT_282380 [Chytridium lagenaria]|nr:hypothetical protein BC829DRAFT_282380 [Chytridium lagenaria]
MVSQGNWLGLFLRKICGALCITLSRRLDAGDMTEACHMVNNNGASIDCETAVYSLTRLVLLVLTLHPVLPDEDIRVSVLSDH